MKVQVWEAYDIEEHNVIGCPDDCADPDHVVKVESCQPLKPLKERLEAEESHTWEGMEATHVEIEVHPDDHEKVVRWSYAY